jgi:tetraacyldisaccharide 4'-kinase
LSPLDDLARRLWAGELGAAGGLLDAALVPAEAAYRAGIAARNSVYDSGLVRPVRVAVPVISIGNVAVGGTGKTPFAHWIAMTLRSLGERPAILHGGYAADEPELHRRWAPDIPVIVERDRVHGARLAIREGATVLVLDDAFQHRRLYRDMDIALVSVERWGHATRVLPRGPLREPRAALRRADLIVCTRKTASPQEGKRVVHAVKTSTNRAVAAVHIAASGWRNGAGAHGNPDGQVVLVAGIAEPSMFEESVRAAGVDVAHRLLFPDHHVYTEADAARIRATAADRVIVTTEKDWTKLDRFLDRARVWMLMQSVIPEEGGALLQAAIEKAIR